VETSARPAVLNAPHHVGRYALLGEIASGGMATVHFGRLVGAVGFSRAVAVKQLHPQFARSKEFVAQFLDEAQLAARIRHPNVVSVLDVVARDGELFIVMEYVEGETLSHLVGSARAPVPVAICSAILTQVLLGLHAAHEAKTEHGTPLEIVHRDVSPQNVLVGVNGVSRLLDFGVAKAVSRVHTTENGKIKGKLSYMAPEQLRAAPLDRRVDVFAAGVVLWELLTGRRLFARSDPGATVAAVLAGDVTPPSDFRPELPPDLDAIVMKALAPAAPARFSTAREMAVALEGCVPPASSLKVSAWLESVAGGAIRARARHLRASEESAGAHASVIIDANALQLRLSQMRTSLPSIDIPREPLPTFGAEPVTLPLRFITGPPPQNAARTWFARGSALAALMLLCAVTTAALRAGSSTDPNADLSPAFGAAPRGPEGPLPKLTEAASASARDGASAGRVLVLADLPLEAAATNTEPHGSTPWHVMRKPPRKVGRPSGRCATPFTVNAQGSKRFDPACF
jgi:eukaryotic-like serine/threonine-protein kinase